MENKYRGKVVGYQFRDYKLGGGCEICNFANRKPVINPSYELSPYLYSFMYGYTHRFSCYECKFAKIPRQGDITLADYWGVKKVFPQMETDSGCSLLLVNTQKGLDMWELIKHSCKYNISNVGDAAFYNSNLIKPSDMPHIRKSVYCEIDEKGYSNIADNNFKSPRYFKIRVLSHVTRAGVMKYPLAIFRRLRVLFASYS
jgi:hypothetical protein